MDYLEPLQVIWDYLCLHQAPQKADCIGGFGNFNTDIAVRAAELYLQGLAPKVLFTGGLGRNTQGLLAEPEAVAFARVAMECGVPAQDILIEERSTNTKENIEFTRQLLEEAGVPYLDLREEMQAEGISVTDAFYTTDHHWKPQTGLWAFGKILEKLETTGAIPSVDPVYTDPGNYSFEIHENTFLGSSGKRTGIHCGRHQIGIAVSGY